MSNAFRWITAGLCALLAACATTPRSAGPASWREARQMIVVTTDRWDASTGVLRRFERGAQGWQPTGAAIDVSIGKAGSAWGTGLHPVQDGRRKHEGDGRSPAGVFAIGTAFGYAADAATAWPYRAMTADDWCIDVNASPLYNRIVDAKRVGRAAIEGSTEPMRRDLHLDGDQRYRLGFVIAHNPGNIAGDGSCIFAHVWKAPGAPTAGCTAMAEDAMRSLLAWLRPQARPVFVLLPAAEYARLRAAWGLPGPGDAPPARRD